MDEWQREEYKALRSEILLQIRLQKQLVALSIGIAGFTLPFVVKEKVADENIKVAILLCYPIITSLLIIAWGGIHNSIARIGNYIKKSYEIKGRLGPAWEHKKGVGLKRLAKLSFFSDLLLICASTLVLPLAAAVFISGDIDVMWQKWRVIIIIDMIVFSISMIIAWFLRKPKP